jgi:hypothetical protein
MICGTNEIIGKGLKKMKVGYVKSGKGSSIAVHWDPHSKEVYVEYAGRSYVGHASNAAEAMTKAEAWLYNK